MHPDPVVGGGPAVDLALADPATAPTAGHPATVPPVPLHAVEVDRDEPLLPPRVHRPADLMRLLTGILAIGLLVGVAAFAHGTASGLEQDLTQVTLEAPALLFKFAGFASSIAVLLVPVAFAIERLIKRDGPRIADGVLAAVLAHGVTLATDLWVAKGAPGSTAEALTRPAPGGVGSLTDPVHGHLAPVIAYMAAVEMSRRPRWRAALWAVLLLDALAMLVTGHTTPLSIALTVLIGWTVAYGTLYAVGFPHVRPTGRTLLTGLRHVGFRPLSAVRAKDILDAPDTGDRGRRYVVTVEDGPPLDVRVIDRERQAKGFFYRVWRRLSLRGITTRRSISSMRQALEQNALLSYAAIAAGAHTPKLIATRELGPDAVMLVYEHLGDRSLDDLPDQEITDDLQRETWRQVHSLQTRRIAHRRLAGDAVVLDGTGRIALTDLRSGEIAASDLVLLMDIAQLLVTFALRTGPVRAIAAAVEVLGPDAVADCLPLLQPLALTRATRATLRRLGRERAQREREAVLNASRNRSAPAAAASQKRSVHMAITAENRAIDEAVDEAREEDLLTQIRHQVLAIRPQATVEPLQLERVKPRTLLTITAGMIGGYFLLGQLTKPGVAGVFQNAHGGWVTAGAAFSALSYLAAAMSLLGFVPEQVPFLRTVAAQVAGSFVKVVTPAAVGGVALNTRFLQRAGVRTGLAVASVGSSQLFGLGVHILLLAAFGYTTGIQDNSAEAQSSTVITALLAVAVLALIVVAVPALRAFVSSRVRFLFAGVIPRMLDILRRPGRLAAGITGMLLLTWTFVLCLYACVRAFAGGDLEISVIDVAVVFLAGNAIGSAVPTPGGVGAVEGALIAGLVLAHVPHDVAFPAVILFRLLTLWLPVLPGWISFNHLTRAGAL
ncbi:lysylphosphatidylglycerol synthase transmembrane domain-containing protein [Streptomyces sp. NPDC048680]|uniref:lysylphosphatidylglycerol synthase transmembrane domain-containing protein n=1 Tax=Streptomyces sp. NPDC048680 TaxID=3155492 RepID=UPI00341D2CC1